LAYRKQPSSHGRSVAIRRNFLGRYSKTKSENAPENFATIRKIALQILTKIPDKESIKNRRKITSCNNNYIINTLLCI
jgi:hypothetical protein